MYTTGIEPDRDEPFLASSQDESARIDEAFSEKLSARACPICARGEFEPLRAKFVIRPRPGAGIEPIEAIGQVCVRCGFLALHSSKYLLEKESQ
jgi:ribosomal protein S27AE